MGRRATTRGDQCGYATHIPAPLGGVVRRVTKDIPDCRRPLLQPLGSAHVVGGTGEGARSSPRQPEVAAADRQRQFPAVPPAVLPGRAPGASVSSEVCGTAPARRCFLCQPPPLVRRGVLSPAAVWPCLPQGRSSGTRGRPRHPISAGSRAGRCAKRRPQVRRGGNRPCCSPQGTNLHRDGISLCQKAEHSIGRGGIKKKERGGGRRGRGGVLIGQEGGGGRRG